MTFDLSQPDWLDVAVQAVKDHPKFKGWRRFNFFWNRRPPISDDLIRKIISFDQSNANYQYSSPTEWAVNNTTGHARYRGAIAGWANEVKIDLVTMFALVQLIIQVWRLLRDHKPEPPTV